MIDSLFVSIHWLDSSLTPCLVQCLSQEAVIWNFPGGPVIKTPHFQCRGMGSIPGWGTKIPRASAARPKKKKKKLSSGLYASRSGELIPFQGWKVLPCDEMKLASCPFLHGTFGANPTKQAWLRPVRHLNIAGLPPSVPSPFLWLRPHWTTSPWT